MPNSDGLYFFAKLDETKTITSIFSATPEFINTGNLGDPSSFIEVEYDDYGAPTCSVGGKYIENKKMLTKGTTKKGWILNLETGQWNPPNGFPPDFFDENGNDANKYRWDNTLEDFIPNI